MYTNKMSAMMLQTHRCRSYSMFSSCIH